MTDKKPEDLTEADLAQQKMGDNSLQGDDQRNVRNQREDQAETKLETDDVVESLKKMDKNYRAEKDLGKGNMDSD